MAETHDIEFERGTSKSLPLGWYQSDDATPMPVADYDFVFSLTYQNNDDFVVSLTSVDGDITTGDITGYSDANILVYIAATKTQGLAPSRFNYELWANHKTDPDKNKRLLYGKVRLK